MSITIECREHPDYNGQSKPEYMMCSACCCVRAFVLELAPRDVGTRVQATLALGDLHVRETEPLGAPTCRHCWSFGRCNKCGLYWSERDSDHVGSFLAPTPDAARAKAAAWVREQGKLAK